MRKKQVKNCNTLQARGGGLAFVHLNPRSIEDNVSDSTPTPALLAYINSDHEYVLFGRHGEQLDERVISHRENRVLPEDTGKAFKSHFHSYMIVMMISYYNITICKDNHLLSMLLVWIFTNFKFKEVSTWFYSLILEKLSLPLLMISQYQ